MASISAQAEPDGFDWDEDPSPSGPVPAISERHAHHFAAISEQVIRGTAASQADGLAFTYVRPDGSQFVVLRPDDPRGGGKYLHPPGGRGLNVHPLARPLMGDTGAPLMIVEGTKQYLAAVSALDGKRIFPVGMSGIRNWQWKPGGPDTPSLALPDWQWIPVVGRKIYIVVDTDALTNDAVKAGEDALAEEMTRRGGEVYRVRVPLVGGDPKTGLDDYLATLPGEGRTAGLLGLLTAAEDDTGAFFLDANDLDQIPPVEPLITGMINKASLVWLSGKFGTYKTFLALAWAGCVATGTAWEGHAVAAPGPVVYVAAEGASGLRNRYHAWVLGAHDGKPADRDRLAFTRQGMDPRSPQHMHRLTAEIKRLGAVLLVIDTLHSCTPGMEENSNKENGAVIGALRKIKDETGCTVLVLHHTGHAGERARGASSMEDDADDAYVIKLKNDPEDRSPSNPRVLERRKSKEGEAGAKFVLTLRPENGSAYVTVDPFDTGGTLAPIPESAVTRIMRELDAAGLPLTLGRDAAREWLAAKGIEIKGRNADLSTAIGARRRRDVPA
ncbi:AAA family ATPase [Streptomyces sp. NPDC007172]|uniref:AAA family ATPase n=1 Tax=Streptomyces sp. NPDC007172 TaxID=3364776 RepID=UPI0036864D45